MIRPAISGLSSCGNREALLALVVLPCRRFYCVFPWSGLSEVNWTSTVFSHGKSTPQRYAMLMDHLLEVLSGNGCSVQLGSEGRMPAQDSAVPGRACYKPITSLAHVNQTRLDYLAVCLECLCFFYDDWYGKHNHWEDRPRGNVPSHSLPI